MNPNLQRILYQISIATFEQLAFLIPVGMPPTFKSEPTLEVEPPGSVDGGNALRCGVAFNGPINGALVLEASKMMLPELTANMLGVEDAPTHLFGDALGEVANVLCGNLLGHLYPSAVFALHPPSENVSTPGRLAASVAISLDAGRVRARFYLDTPVAETASATSAVGDAT